MLKECTTSAYIKLLEGLTTEIGPKSYDYWPPKTNYSETSCISSICSEAFWQKVFQSRCKLYVVDDPSSTHGFESVASEEAVFDILNESESQAIRKILVGHNLSKIVRPSARMRQCLTMASLQSTYTCVSPAYLRSLAKKDMNAAVLKKFWKNNGNVFMKNYLNIICRDCTSTDTLNGCWMLPLESGRIGRFRHDFNLGESYFLFNEDSKVLKSFEDMLKLFTYNSDKIISNDMGPAMIKNLKIGTSSVSQNVQEFCLDHVEALFNQHARDTALREPERYRAWLTLVWRFLEKHSEDISFESRIASVPILSSKVSSWSSPVFISMNDFENDMTILEQSNTDLTIMLQSLPKLHIVERTTFPKRRREREQIHGGHGLSRILTKIQAAARNADMILSSFISKYWNLEQCKVR